MVGLSRVAGGRADAAVFFVDQVFIGEFLVAAEAPGAASFGVQVLGECLGQTIGEGFGHDRVVVVVLAVEVFGEFVAAEAGGDREGADVILAAAIGGGNEIGERVESGLAFAFPLLPQGVEAAAFFAARFVSVNDDVV